jgi:hypothetical protein
MSTKFYFSLYRLSALECTCVKFQQRRPFSTLCLLMEFWQSLVSNIHLEKFTLLLKCPFQISYCYFIYYYIYKIDISVLMISFALNFIGLNKRGTETIGVCLCNFSYLLCRGATHKWPTRIVHGGWYGRSQLYIITFKTSNAYNLVYEWQTSKS